MPTKIVLKRLKGKQQRLERRLRKEKSQMVRSSEILLQDSVSASVEAAVAPSLDKNADSASSGIIPVEVDATRILDKHLKSACKETVSIEVPISVTVKNADSATAKIALVASNSDGDSTSAVTAAGGDSDSTEIASVELCAAPTLDKNSDSASVEIAPIYVDVASLVSENADSFIARAASPEAPNSDKNVDSASVEAPSMLTLANNAESACVEIAANPVKNAADTSKKLTWNSNRFMDNFNPETSSRERRKLNRQIRNAGTAKRHPGALYDENGIHIASGQDICDCLFPKCPGCFYECPKCASIKCGLECRVNRKFVYEQVDFEGINLTLKFQDVAK